MSSTGGPRSSPGEALGMPLGSAVLANLLAISPVLLAAVLHSTHRDLYYRMAQEDGALEWATFWALLAASAVFLLAARRQRRADEVVPWFLVGVALFCLFVAGEEISWGQRVFGYRPPAYFLEENFQQELNLHNVWDTSLRKLLAKAALLVYGVALPLAALAGPIRRLLARLAVVTPPLAVLPIFLVAFLVYQSYPWKFSGEIIELVMACGFLFAALAALRTGADPGGRRDPSPGRVAAAFVAVFAFAFAAAALNQLDRKGSSELERVARTELEAMAEDLVRGGRPLSRCGIHKRVYSWVEKYEIGALSRGAFAGLVAKGLPETRAEFFIDPWNSPYWIRHRCKDGRRKAFIYSFGPDRRRQSTEWELGGDDIGIVYYQGGR